jgi:hypothetical protein
MTGEQLKNMEPNSKLSGNAKQAYKVALAKARRMRRAGKTLNGRFPPLRPLRRGIAWRHAV